MTMNGSGIHLVINDSISTCLNTSPPFSAAAAIATVLAMLSLAVSIFGSYINYKSYQVTRHKQVLDSPITISLHGERGSGRAIYPRSALPSPVPNAHVRTGPLSRL